MNVVHMSGIDLNLLLALDALLREENVTRAAARVGVTQSAMSHALARLRALFGDELLVRTSGGMTRTLRAESLAGPLSRALEEVAKALSPPATFDPATARARIVIGTSDYGELILLPRLVPRLARAAPGVELRIFSLGDDIAGPLASGAIDIAVAPIREEDAGPGIRGRRLFDERFVCVMRRGHPLAKTLATRGARLPLKAFADADHALIAPRGKEGGFVDDALAKLGHRRRVALALPHFLIAPHVVAASDLILTLAERVARLLADPLKLTITELPRKLDLRGFTMSAIWHERTHDDPARRWMRDQLVEVAREVA